MSERWTSPKAGPFPSGHLIVRLAQLRSYPYPFVYTRCGQSPLPQIRPDQEAAITSEPPATSEGRTCETCLRLANRDRREPEDDGSTQPVETVP